MRTIVSMLMVISSLSPFVDLASAQSTRQLPYSAFVLDDEAYARSGPGKQYYPTSRFRKGDAVTVVRHDPGGWFMIEPPAGSFAWVRQEFVKREGDRGTIVSDSAVVAWVGTSFGDDHFVEQRRLHNGEEVEIVAEKNLQDERGEVAYLKIKPPKGHFRWIPGAKVGTDKKQVLAQTGGGGSDPFGNEGSAANRVRDPNVAPINVSELEPDETGYMASNDKSVPAPRDLNPNASASKKAPSESPSAKSQAQSNNVPDTNSPFSSATDDNASENISVRRERLAALDQQLQEMVKQETRTWDFTEIEQNLRELQNHDDSANAASRRLAQLDKYKQIKADYDEFARIMAETNRRDAELTATQRSAQSFMPPTVVPEGPPQQPTRPANTNRAPVPVPNGLSRPAQPGRTPAPAIRSRATPAPQPAPSNTPAKRRFGGAGIIQRSAVNVPNAPKHVLVHPDGRLLAFLQGDGVDLDQHLGESMGVDGERTFRPELRSDFIVVKTLQPVKLKP